MSSRRHSVLPPASPCPGRSGGRSCHRDQGRRELEQGSRSGQPTICRDCSGCRGISAASGSIVDFVPLRSTERRSMALSSDARRSCFTVRHCIAYWPCSPSTTPVDRRLHRGTSRGVHLQSSETSRPGAPPGPAPPGNEGTWCERRAIDHRRARETQMTSMLDGNAQVAEPGAVSKLKDLAAQLMSLRYIQDHHARMARDDARGDGPAGGAAECILPGPLRAEHHYLAERIGETRSVRRSARST